MEPILTMINGQAYGPERTYNALRSARLLYERFEAHISMFLRGDVVTCARKEQIPPAGHYNLAKTMVSIMEDGVEVGACGSCVEAQGIGDKDLVAGTRRISMKELNDRTVEASKVVSF